MADIPEVTAEALVDSFMPQEDATFSVEVEINGKRQRFVLKAPVDMLLVGREPAPFDYISRGQYDFDKKRAKRDLFAKMIAEQVTWHFQRMLDVIENGKDFRRSF